ncbi:MAG: hypothetical protein QF897_00150, partial [Gammaproteobacteria bacterium]|nr:hypothetical protein [Gammaproteobacteria bacterium]
MRRRTTHILYDHRRVVAIIDRGIDTWASGAKTLPQPHTDCVLPDRRCLATCRRQICLEDARIAPHPLGNDFCDTTLFTTGVNRLLAAERR